ncbi:MAG: BNR-repeat neuraminidase N-terminal domain-containing protein, partial [Bacteroidota bacterium]|nr:BNR-repeat neuraminidase N-terminal domain-containing protein [Bacteroidota bacterium]
MKTRQSYVPKSGINLLLLLALFIGMNRANSQVSTYVFSQSTTTYTPITGGTVLSAAGVGNDDNQYASVPIGFGFAYSTGSYTTLGVSANGYAKFGGTTPGNFYDGTSIQNVANAVHILSEDLHGTSATCEIRYQTIGTPGNQIFILQWKDWGFYSNSGNEINFQLKLYESNGVIQYVYSPTTPSTSQTCQVGLTGTAVSDFIGRQSATSWTASTAMTGNTQQIAWSSSIYPSAGLTFTYSPPPCSGTPAPGNTTTTMNAACVGINFTLGVQNTVPGTGLVRQWQSSPDSLVWTDIAGATGATLSTTQTVATYYRDSIACGASYGISVPKRITMTSGGPCLTYCTAITTSPTVTGTIGRFTFGSLANPAANPTPQVPNSTSNSGYTDYTSLPTLSFNYGVTYPVSVYPIYYSNAYPMGASVFIDFNIDGDFADAGERFNLPYPGVTGASSVGNITLPVTGTLGVTRMRVINNYSAIPVHTNGCGTNNYGEVEDYFINLLPAPPMVFSSSTSTQTLTTPVATGVANQQVIGIQVVTSGVNPQINLTQLHLNTTGTTSLSDITNAKVYYTGTSSTFATTTQFGSTVSSPGATFNISGTQALDTGTNYFWLTYDISASAASNNIVDAGCDSIMVAGVYYYPTVTAPAGSRTIRPQLNGTYTVGTSVASYFPTITAAVNELAAVGSTGPVVFSLVDNTYNAATNEVFPITINAINSTCSNCDINNPNLTIRPAAGSTGVLIEGLAAGTSALFNLSGSRYLVFDGRPGGSGTSKTMVISNGNTSNPVFNILNDARAVTIRDCFIKSANTSTISGAIYIGGSTGANGNDSITITNNTIRNYADAALPTMANAIYSIGQSATVQNDYYTISNNNIYRFTTGGIVVPATTSGNGAYWTITGNSFYDTAAITLTTAMTAINFTPSTSATNSFGHVISGNYFGGTAPMCAGTAMTFTGTSGSFTGILASNSTTATATLIQNNVFQNINMSAPTGFRSLNGIITQTAGSFIIGGSGANIFGDRTVANSIQSANNGAIIAFSNSSAGTITITNNVIANVTMTNTGSSAAFRGILSTSGTGTQTISGDSIYNISMLGNVTGAGQSAGFVGIGVSSSPTSLVLSNNIIGGTPGTIRNVSVGLKTMVGIAYAGSGINNLIQNNVISNFTSFSTYTSSTTLAAFNGLYIVGGTNSISGNAIQNIRLSSFSATQLNGLLATSGTNTINGNTISYLVNPGSNTGSTTSAGLNGMLISSTLLQTVTNNTIDSLTATPATAASTQINGIYVAGTTGNIITGNNITRFLTNASNANVINPSIVGLMVNTSGLNQTISQNTIHTLSNTNATIATGIYGMSFILSTSSASNTSIIARNNIHSIALSTTAAGSLTGIQLTNGYAIFQNNMIRLGINAAGTVLTGPYIVRGFNITGTNFGAANGLRIYHNSVHLAGTSSGATNTAGIEFPSTVSTGSAAIRNNIFSNTISGGTGFHCGIKLANITNINSNNNLYYFPGTGGRMGMIGATAYTTIAGTGGWAATTRQDGNSGIGNPNFILPGGTSSTGSIKLQSPTPAEGMGDATASVADNFDGLSRGTRTPVDVGADAGNFTLSSDGFAPIITFTALNNPFVSTSRTLTVSITDGGGIPVSGTNVPRIYYKKNAAGTFTSAAGTLDVGTATSGQWSFVIDHTSVGGIVPYDSIYYYIIAQDLNGNIVSSQPYAVATDVNTIVSHPFPNTILNNYRMNTTLATSILVGTGNPITSLTANDATGLFFNINSGAISGNTEVLITSNITESGAAQLNSITQVNAGVAGNFGYTLTIRPQTNTQYILSGANISGLIRLNGASAVTFSGVSPTGTAADTNLVFVNASSAPVFQFSTDASNDSLYNIVIRGRNTSTGSGLVYITTAGTGSGNDNINITGCNIYSDQIIASPYANGIYSVGTFAKENDNLVVVNNNIFNFSNSGVLFTSNSGNGLIIRGNHFYNNNPALPTTTMTVIQILSGSVSNGDSITGNYIGGRDRLCGGTAQTNTGAVTFTGINCTVGTSSGVSIQGNTIQNFNYSSVSASTFTGIQVNSGVANIGGVSGNLIGSSTVANSIINAGNSVTTGIIYSGSNAVIVSNNTVANIQKINTGTSAAIRGIMTSNTSNGLTINNNNVNNLYTTSGNSGSTTIASLVGIGTTNSGSSQSITNNTVFNLANANTTTSSIKVVGMFSTSGLNNFTGNQVRNLSNSAISTGTTTSAAIIGIYHSGLTGSVVSNNLVDTINTTGVGSTQTIGMYTTGTSQTLTDNIVRRLSSASNSINTTSASSIIGIMYNGGSSNINISRNTVHTLNATNTTGGNGQNIIGMYATISTGGTNVVNRNAIHSLGSVSTMVTNIYGMYIAGGSTGYSNNMIRLGYDANGNALNAGMYNIYGITLGTSSGNNFYHNSIYVTNNYTQPTPPYLNTQFTAAFNQIISASAVTNIKNNIFMNEGTNMGTGNAMVSGTHAAMRLASTANISSNFNIFSVGDTTNGGVYVSMGTSSTGASNSNYIFFKGQTASGTLPSWQALNQSAPFDMNSGAGNPSFINRNGTSETGDLHLNSSNPAEGAGDPSLSAVITDDFDGAVRNDSSAVDIGADGGNFTKSPDLFAPVITYTALTNTPTIVNRTIDVTITDNIGVGNTVGTRPVMYFKKGSGLALSASAGTLTSGTVTNGTWNFTFNYTLLGGAAQGDTISYFFAAQDAALNTSVAPIFGIASDVNTILDTPDIFSSFRISTPLATTINVGPNETYKCLTCLGDTGLFNAINNGFLAGNTVVNIVGDTLTESGDVALNNWLETASGLLGNYNYSLTIRPGSGGVNTKKLIKSDFAGITLRFVGTDNLTLTGIGAGGSANDTNLVLRNRNLTAGVVSLTNDASRNTFTNLIVEGRSSGTNSLFTIGTTTNTTGNDSILISNSYFRADTSNNNAGNGLVSSGTTGKDNDNLTIENCHFYNINQVSIFMNAGTGNNIKIRNNHVYHNSNAAASANVFYGIIMQGTTLSNNDTITGNYIGGSGPNAAMPAFNSSNPSGFNGMGILSGSVTGTYINNNFIQNITNSAGGITGIGITGGIAMVTNNTIGSTTANSLTSLGNSSVVGIQSSTSSDITIQNNTIRNL